MTPNPGAENSDETAFVQAAQTGDSDAFERLLDLHITHLRTFLSLKSPVAHLVDELTHETFVFAFRHLSEFKPGTSFRAWLRAIAWNLLRREVQRFSREMAKKERLVTRQEQDWPELEGEAEPAPEAEYLEQCVQELPESFRELLTLKYRQEHSTEEIAALVRRSLVWVRTSLFRIRQQLRSCIERRQANSPP